MQVDAMRSLALLPLQYPDLMQAMGIDPPRGILFHGVAGSGKTSAVRALAGELAKQAPRPVAFYVRKGADCLGKYVGDAERTLRLLFDDARARAPSIIFLDELDALAPARATRESTQDQARPAAAWGTC
ncbi:PHD-type domain-containing protein [Haematococcus lacustris]|uniref:PHD-type domain-containing protein n=1 Tax=Haematococcus lacustris TaxID=44745 RepID=A0A699Y9Q2_HAELA|nr:PHD-type domain-containing protein [Haematococcus lacustris]